MKRQKSKRIHLTVLRMRECRPKLFHLLLCYFSTLITKKCGMECVCVRWRVWQSQTWACKLANSFSVSLFVAHIELQKQTVLLRCFHTEFAVNVNLNVVIESHTAIDLNKFIFNEWFWLHPGFVVHVLFALNWNCIFNLESNLSWLCLINTNVQNGNFQQTVDLSGLFANFRLRCNAADTQIRTYVFNYYQLRSVNVRLLHNLQSCYRNSQQHTYCEIYAGNYLWSH